MKKRMIILMMLALMGSGVAEVWAQTSMELTQEESDMIRQSRQKRQKKNQMKDRMREELGLTEQQQRQLQEHRKNQRMRGKAKRENVKALKEQLKAELENFEFDNNKVQQIHQQIKAMQAQMADEHLEGVVQVRKILDAEQFKKFSELQEQRKGKNGRGGQRQQGNGQFGYKGSNRN